MSSCVHGWLLISVSLSYPDAESSVFLSNDSAMSLLVCFSLLVLMTERHPFDAVYSPRSAHSTILK